MPVEVLNWHHLSLPAFRHISMFCVECMYIYYILLSKMQLKTIERLLRYHAFVMRSLAIKDAFPDVSIAQKAKAILMKEVLGALTPVKLIILKLYSFIAKFPESEKNTNKDFWN